MIVIQTDTEARYEPTHNWLQAAHVIEQAEAQLMMRFGLHCDDRGRWAATAWVTSRAAKTLYALDGEQIWCPALRLAAWKAFGPKIVLPV